MKLEIKGYNLDNLIKTLQLKKINLYNINYIRHNEISFEIQEKDYKKTKRFIANFKVKQGLTKAKKLPFFLLTNLGLILAIFIGSVFFLFVSNYTWQIKVYGTQILTEKEILQVLEKNNIKKGKINLQSGEDIETILLNNYDRIAQVSVIKQGTAIIINLSEKLVYVEKEFEPIVAKANGIINNINVITGTLNVKIGDYVNIGDVLVLPFNLNADGSKVSVKPIAEISAEIYTFTKCEMNKHETVLVRTGRFFEFYKYKLGKLNLFSGKNKKSFALFETVVYNENISRLIPLNRDVFVNYELAETVITHNFEQEQADLKEKCLNLARQNLISGDIIDEKTEIKVVGDKMCAMTTIKVIGVIHD